MQRKSYKYFIIKCFEKEEEFKIITSTLWIYGKIIDFDSRLACVINNNRTIYIVDSRLNFVNTLRVLLLNMNTLYNPEINIAEHLGSLRCNRVTNNDRSFVASWTSETKV